MATSCPHCGADVASGRQICKACGKNITVAPEPVAPIDPEATKTCPYCAETIKAAATVCRYCGKDLLNPAERPSPIRTTPVQTTPIQATSTKTGRLPAWGWIVAIIGGTLLLVMIAGGGRSTAPSTPRVPDQFDAFVACKDWVSQSLKAPSQAKWPTANDAEFVNMGGGRWRVDSYVEAPNPLGVMLREPYTCEVTIANERWQGQHLTVGDLVIK